MPTSSSIERAARARLARSDTRDQIENSLRSLAEGNPLAAEWDDERLRDRIQARLRVSRADAGAVASTIQRRAGVAGPAARAGTPIGPSGPERIYGETLDFVPIAFLSRGSLAGRAVARVAFRDGRAQGTGFMVSDRLFLTNNHVLGRPQDAAQFKLEFDYELDPEDRLRGVTAFELDPSAFFLTNDQDDLDYTLVAVGERFGGDGALATFGVCPLSSARDKHALGEVANIVQHPDGRYKEVVLRENRLVSRLDTVLHYVADTEPGSSGSPVFNNDWEVIALHHWGGPWRQQSDDAGAPVPREVNEGIRITAILKDLVQRGRRLTGAKRDLLRRVLEIGEARRAPAAAVPTVAPAALLGPISGDGAAVRVAPDGTLTVRLPIEISIRVPGGGIGLTATPTIAVAAGGTDSGPAPRSAERAVDVDPDYAGRRGYRDDFLPGFRVALPSLNERQRRVAARNRRAGTGDDPHELRYEHFSVVLNARRRLAFFTACNVDGTLAKSVNRNTGAVTARRPGGGESAEGAESTETWFDDPRLDGGAAATQALYDDQRVPGVPNRRSAAFRNRMFQRGHLVRRADPAWGTDGEALRADADTFHFTNCTPQVGFFNMGTASPAVRDSGGGRLWRALEDYVLENAVAEGKRVTVFTGPVLDDRRDLPWRTRVIPGFRVPRQFWKVVVWTADGGLCARALLADQTKAIETLPEALAAERFADVAPVEDFLTTVAEVERLTGLAFDPGVRAADLGGAESAGASRRKVTSFDEIDVASRGTPRRAPRRVTGVRAPSRR